MRSMNDRRQIHRRRTTSTRPEGSAVQPASAERVQKLLARLGYGSRREIESWISAGRVRIDGRGANLGDRISDPRQVTLDGKSLPAVATAPTPRVLIYHKPVGQITSRRDPEGRDSVFEHLPRPRQGRWVAVGRLDINTQGLLLLTTDGELAHRLMHPSSAVEREYAVRVRGPVAPEELAKLQSGVELDGEHLSFRTIVDAGGEGSNHWYHVVLAEGRNREVRRLWETIGAQVSRLLRVRYGPVALPRRLRAGRSLELDPASLAELYRAVDLPPPAASPAAKSTVAQRRARTGSPRRR